jgi:hypothetical protein
MEGMANANWAHVEEVGDQSRYVSTLKEIPSSNCSEILPRFQEIFTPGVSAIRLLS